MAAPSPSSTPPSGATSLARKLGPGWRVFTHAGTGTCEYGGRSEDTDGNGKTHLISVTEPVESYLVRAHNDDGRAFVAVWLSRTLRPTKSGGKSWSMDMAWRGRHQDEHTPTQLAAGELNAYLEGQSAEDALNAVQHYNEAQAVKAEAARRKKGKS